MKLPQDLHYTKEHVWLKHVEGDVWITGITDHAQELLGDIVFVDAPKVGSHITQTSPCGLVESVKTGADLHAPMSGEVIELNADLASNPQLINDHPYKTWIYKFKANSTKDDAGLLNADEYEALLN